MSNKEPEVSIEYFAGFVSVSLMDATEVYQLQTKSLTSLFLMSSTASAPHR